MIIGLLGRKGSGKTLAASVLEAKGFRRLSFAGPLKRILSEAFQIPLYMLTDSVAKEEQSLNIDLDSLNVRRILDEAHKIYPISEEQTVKATLNAPNVVVKTPRQLLQVVGTDIFRNNVDVSYWLNVFSSQVDSTSDYVIDDVRFDNERQVIENLGGYIVGIERMGLENKDLHSSEHIDLSQVHFKINNKYNREVFISDVENVYQLIKQELEWQRNQKSATRQNSFGGNSAS